MSRTSLPTDVDTLVIGGGTGGAAFAGTLAAHSGESVLLLEAGPDYGARADGQWPHDLLDARSIPLSHDYDLHTQTGASGAALDLPRARVLGGCSSHNGCTASIGAHLDYDEWAAWGNAGWSSTDVTPLLHWARDRFRVRRYRLDELTVPQRAFVEAGLAAGLPYADDLDTLEAAEGIGPMPVNVVNGVRWNSAFAFLDPVRQQPNLTVVGRAEVQRLVIENGAARGAVVRTSEGETLIHAGRVVVCAGAYHSPALLLRSGVGPADELRALEIDVVLDLPGVGRHLLDHSCIQLNFAGQPGLLGLLAERPWSPDEQTVGRARSSRCDDGPYDIHVFMVAGSNSGHPELPPISLYGGAMRALSEGRVTLAPDLDVTRPLIDHCYGTDPGGYDRQVLREAADLLLDMASRAELAEVLGQRVILNGQDDPLAHIVNYCHPAGSCKMGPSSDPQAVVDPRGQVHGVQGLYVADASIMPAISRGNINLPTAMIGARVAAFLLGQEPQDVVNASVAVSGGTA
ncbi:GMC family oxidoreductase [Deinococcus sp. QL22]|uniref:GMC family oxidoreductase n=1 Tax=Deinococcus sp. QL22 TaxID=2939437 RepID=UPI00201738B3|nr:GMC family oxidoreductase [Deinococcus sp. QL22]UQN08268.1 GMC family oxidoreductase [Deinococcus sp. QL22]